jgi:hypothetical protein
MFFCSGVFLLFCVSALADPALVAQLDDPDYGTRLAATQTLLTDDTLTPERLAAWVPAAPSVEQRHRLLRVAEHHTLRRLQEQRFEVEGRGSMGVVQTVKDRDDAGDARSYALVTRVLSGFPAAGRLRPLDRIVALDGEPIPGPADARAFEAMMRRYEAGHELSLTVERGGQTLTVSIPLINSRALAAFYQPPAFGLHAPYQEAWEAVRDQHFSALRSPEAASAVD